MTLRIFGWFIDLNWFEKGRDQDFLDSQEYLETVLNVLFILYI